eukprot:scaffold73592_cov66-Phaeocystis_antarctica.AAC.2
MRLRDEHPRVALLESSLSKLSVCPSASGVPETLDAIFSSVQPLRYVIYAAIFEPCFGTAQARPEAGGHCHSDGARCAHRFAAAWVRVRAAFGDG